MRSRGTVPGRFGGFAVGHFALVLLYILFALLPRAEISAPSPLSQVLSALSFFVPILCYLPAGYVVSRLRRWPRPDRKTAFLSVLFPTLCAWGWAFGGLGLLLLFSGREALFPLAFTGFALLALSFLLASPSALFMLLTLDLLSGSLRDAGVNAFFQSSAWFAAMFLAGLLPPLLFFLGSLLPKKRLTTAKNVIE